MVSLLSKVFPYTNLTEEHLHDPVMQVEVDLK